MAAVPPPLSAAVEAELRALLPDGGAEAAPLPTLEGAAGLCRKRADEARHALYTGVAAHYERGADAAADAVTDAALATLIHADARDATLRELAMQHAEAAAEVASLRASAQAARSVSHLAAAVEQAEALLLAGRTAAAAAQLAAASAAAQALRETGCAPALLATQEALSASLGAALSRALMERVRYELDEPRHSGSARVQPAGDESLSALWDGVDACGADAAAACARSLAAAALERLLAPILSMRSSQADVSSEQLSWRAVQPDDSGDAARAVCAALSFLCDAALGSNARARYTFGAALWTGLAACLIGRMPPAASTSAAEDTWREAAAGAAAIDAAAASLGMLSNAARQQPVADALAAARAHAETTQRGEWLAKARACVLSSSSETVRVGGPWRERGAGRRAAGEAAATGALCFPDCCVSAAAVALADLLSQRLAGARDVRAASDAADVLRACAPCSRAAELRTAPGAAMLFCNDAHFVAFCLAGGAAVARAPQLGGVAAALCATGDAWLALAVEAAAADAAAALETPGGFAGAAAPARRAAVERALAGGLHAARRFDALARATLPACAAAAASGAVLSAVGDRAATEVLALPDIGVDDGAALCAAFDAACAGCDSMPLRSAHGWRKAAAVRALLEAPLASIAADAEAGQLHGLMPAELAGFVRAVFCESSQRAAALRRIEDAC